MTWKTFAPILVALLLAVAPCVVCADTLILKKGTEVKGRIVAEDDTTYRVNIGTGELVIRKSNVKSVERGLPVDLLLSQGGKSLKAAEDALARKDMNGAQREAGEALGRLEGALKGAAEVPPELAKLRSQLEEVRRKSLPQDADAQDAERLYQEALEAINHIDYQKALGLLKQSAAKAPTRADVQFKLGTVADQVQDEATTIEAYRATLKLDPEAYYDRVGKPLLQHLELQGRRLLAERRTDNAIDVYSEILLLKGSAEGEPASLADFVARSTTRATKSEEDLLMEVYQFADDADLVDLAFAAATKVEKINPDHPGIKSLVAESGFLTRFRNSIASNNVEEASRLLAEAPPELLASEKVAARVKEFSGELGPAVRAQSQLAKAKAAFDAGDYAKAAEEARKTMLDFPEQPAAKDAAALLRAAELEGPVRKALDEAEALVDDGKDAEAETKLTELKANTEKIEESVQLPRLNAILESIPLQKQADEMWNMAAAELDREDYEKALQRLEELESKFSATRAGKRAAEYLKSYREKLMRQSALYKPPETEYFRSLTDPDYWRAASIPEAAGKGPLVVAPVVPEGRGRAMEVFDDVMQRDLSFRVDSRSRLLHIVLPVMLGGMVLLSLFWVAARPGSGQLREIEELADAAHKEGSAVVLAGRCRTCGQQLAGEELVCRACGCSKALSEDEEMRQSDDQRRANFDPWDIRVKAANLNEFEKHYRRAVDLSETSDAQAALEACREALHEDPHSIRGYTLMAALHERMNQREQAAKCYRELLLLDPADAVVRQKLESMFTAPALVLGRCAPFLSGCLWWMILVLTLGLDPHDIILRVVLCAVGFGLTTYYLNSRQKTETVTHRASDTAPPIDVQRPLPLEDLTWGEQNRQAKLLADAIRSHTGIEVPALTVTRLLLALIGAAVLLVALVMLAWLSHSPVVLLAWPAGVALLLFLVEIHPRLYVAMVLLRHCQEETLSPWVDPHRPFVPKGAEPKPQGEFLATDVSHLPLRWALKPHPYPATRQGLLNSLQQTLNRHWAFHGFYGQARVVRGIEIPVPTGRRGVGLGATLFLAACIAIAAVLGMQQRSAARTYSESMTIGYQYLLEGDIQRASEYFFEAMRRDPRRLAPHLYLGHAYAAAGLKYGAERSFRAALAREGGRAVAANDYANFLQRQGRMREALAQYQTALETDPNNADILSNAGSACFKLKRSREAVEFLRRATAADPNHKRAWVTLGLALEQEKDKEGAKAAYEKAVQVAPDETYTKVARQRLESDLAPDESKELRIPKTPKP